MKVLIMGLSGSGKTTLAKDLAYHFELPHYNADTMREAYDDWDFSIEGRLRQANRMASRKYGILDFICPLEKTRNIVNPDLVIYMDTIQQSLYEDTNKIFEKPETGLRITQWIPQSQLHNSLEGFNPGIRGIQNYLDGPLQRLVRSLSY